MDHGPLLPSLRFGKSHERESANFVAFMELQGKITHKRPLGGATIGAVSVSAVMFAILIPGRLHDCREEQKRTMTVYLLEEKDVSSRKRGLQNPRASLKVDMRSTFRKMVR